MNLIDQRLQEIKAKKRLGLMTHVVVGYPSLEGTEQIIKTMDHSGADFIELQIPFSDPLADGPTIMVACEGSLKNGTKVADAFNMARKLSKQVSAPLLFMAYFNTVFKYGIEKFCRDSAEAGISGLIIPDIPIEEEKDASFMQFCKSFNLKHIHVISPASTPERLLKNASVANGFIYCTARQGITDAKKGLDPKIADYLKLVRKTFHLPIATGFGISSKERVDMIRSYSDIAVVGSAIIDIIRANPSNYLGKLEKFLINLI